MDTLIMYLKYPFVRYALIVGVLVSLCASVLGVPLVLKRFSFIGDGLSHVAFGAMCVATVLKITDNMLVILPVTIVSAVLILRTGDIQSPKLKKKMYNIQVVDAEKGIVKVEGLKNFCDYAEVEYSGRF